MLLWSEILNLQVRVDKPTIYNMLLIYVINMKTDVNDEMLKKISYVNISSYRAKTVKSLQGDVKIPTKIAKDTGILPNHMSKVLKELKDAGIAECINEEARKGRLYRLTDLGDEIAGNLSINEKSV